MYKSFREYINEVSNPKVIERKKETKRNEIARLKHAIQVSTEDHNSHMSEMKNAAAKSQHAQMGIHSDAARLEYVKNAEKRFADYMKKAQKRLQNLQAQLAAIH